MDFIYVLMRKLVVGIVRAAVIAAADIAAFARDAFLGLLGRSSEKSRVLVVRVDGIGDYILWLDAARRLRGLYPTERYEITLVCNVGQESLAGDCEYFDRVWTLDRERFKELPYHFGLLARTRLARFKVAIQPTYSRDYFGDLVMIHCGAPVRIGSAGDTSNIDGERKARNDRLYTKLIPASPEPMMELVRNAEFMRGLGLDDFSAGLPELLVRKGSPVQLPEGDYYVLFPGAGWYRKKWPLSSFADLAVRIHGETGWTGVVCGEKTEAWMGEALMREAAVPMVNLGGRTGLTELAATLEGARMLVSNDTSAVHIAAAVSTPSVCILGGGHFGRFLPYKLEMETDRPVPVPVHLDMECFNCNWDCKYHVRRGEPMPCISGVTVEMVWDAVAKVLEGMRDGQRR